MRTRKCRKCGAALTAKAAEVIVTPQLRRSLGSWIRPPKLGEGEVLICVRCRLEFAREQMKDTEEPE
ncbi:MAG TPA: hypothetical protein VGG32_10525 [Thermoplasmata archaeon]|jgi:hypothetical protein